MNNMTDFNDLHLAAGPDAVKECINFAINSIASCASDTGATAQLSIWPVPKEIKTDLPPAPAFDAKALLPATLADFVLDEADRMPCSPDYIAAALIVCLGSVIGARCGIKPKRRDDWIVTPNLFGGIVGDPSSKKSPALGTVTRFLDRLEAKEAAKLEDAKRICLHLGISQALRAVLSVSGLRPVMWCVPPPTREPRRCAAWLRAELPVRPP